jgi:glycosyltransferase involved in cell wall biosynthesis
MPLRIAISTLMIQRGQSGVAQHVLALLRALKEHAAEHEFIVLALEEDLPLLAFARDAMRLVSVPERFRPPLANIAWHQCALPRLIRRHPVDVLHVPSYRRMLWPRPCALVATIHDLAVFRVPHKYDPARMLYGRVVARHLAHRQHQIIAISRHTANDLTSFFRLPGNRINIVHNGMDHSRFFPADPAAARAAVAQRYRFEQPFFLYVARLEHPAKNHLRLIAAFNRFKARTKSPLQLALAGSDWHGADVIHAFIRQSPCANEIRHLGFVPDQDLPDLYRAATAAVYPSLYEGFGLPPVEAMACACPVLSSTRGALGEVVGDAALTVDPEDINALAAGLERLAREPDLRKRLCQAGPTQARQFDWRTTAAATLTVYRLATLLHRLQPLPDNHRSKFSRA